MKKFLGILLCLFGVFVMSHNAGAAARLGFYTNYSTNLLNSSGGALSGNLQNNIKYTVQAQPNRGYYASGGYFNYQKTFKKGEHYYVALTVLYQYACNATVMRDFQIYNDAVNLTGANGAFRTVKDDVDISSFVSSGYCNTSLIHNVELEALTDSSVDYIYTTNTNLVSGFNGTSSNQLFDFTFSGYWFDSKDEWAWWRDDVLRTLNGIHSDTTDIVDTLGEINDKLDALDSNADANAEAWENMQDTDGLVDIGDDSQARSIVGSINSVLGQVRDIPASVGCTINANFVGRINLGDLNLCTGKDTLGGVVSFCATVIFLFISFFIVIRIIKKVLRLISWCRKN